MYILEVAEPLHQQTLLVEPERTELEQASRWRHLQNCVELVLEKHADRCLVCWHRQLQILRSRFHYLLRYHLHPETVQSVSSIPASASSAFLHTLQVDRSLDPQVLPHLLPLLNSTISKLVLNLHVPSATTFLEYQVARPKSLQLASLLRVVLLQKMMEADVDHLQTQRYSEPVRN